MKAALILLSFASISCLAGDEAKSSKNYFDLTTFTSTDQSEFSLGVKWNLEWERVSDWSHIRFATSGAWATDDHLNQTPLVTQMNAGGYWHLWGSDIERDQSPTDILEENPGLAEMGLRYGLTARYETDQALDHRNGVGSAFFGFNNTNRFNLWGLIPSLYVSVDGVIQDKNTSVAALGGSIYNYERFYVAVNWEIPFEAIGKGWLMERLRLYEALEYTKSFGSSSQFKATGQDETFAWLTELLFTVDEGLNGRNKFPLYFYLQYASGRFAPQPEDEQRILTGFRFKF